MQVSGGILRYLEGSEIPPNAPPTDPAPRLGDAARANGAPSRQFNCGLRARGSARLVAVIAISSTLKRARQ